MDFSHGYNTAAGASACPAPAGEGRTSCGYSGQGDHRVVVEAG